MKWYMFGETRDSDNITVDQIDEVMEVARTRVDAIRNVPEIYILDVLDRVGRTFADVESDFCQEVADTMHRQLGWSREMVLEGLKTISDILKLEHLAARIIADIGDFEYLDEFTYNKAFRGMVKAEPSGIISHVSAGNVFVGAVDTLVQGLITKNVNILKMSSADPVFPMIFADVLKRCDYLGTLSRSFALVPFKGGDKAVEAVIKEKSDVLVVYGGEETVKAYREGTGFHTRIIEYGPKYSLCILSASMLTDDNMQEVATTIARDFTMWEQSACSSPHAVFVDSAEKAEKFAHALADGLQHWAEKIPHSSIPTNEAVEIVRTRELARVDQALGEAELIIPSVECQDWTVILQKQCKFKVSPHHRTAFVIISPDHATATLDALSSYGKFIQSISLLMPVREKLAMSDALVGIGADRVTDIGMMARRKHGTPHDGTRGTSEMLRWVSIGSDKPFENPFDYWDDEKREKYRLAKLNAFLHFVREHSPFYHDRIPDITLTSLSQLSNLPVLTPDELKSHNTLTDYSLLALPLSGGISFGSGGTTGAPKFISRTNLENHYNARLIGKGYALSVFDSTDTVANLLFAGNMWASFLSHNEAIEATGAHVLPIAGNIAMEDIVSVLKVFRPTGAVSIPSVILSLAEYVEKHNLDIRIPKIVTGGEHLYPEAKAYIARVLGTVKFASTGYLSNDTGCIGFQCEHTSGAVHHIHESYCIMEVVDPETNMPVPDGEPGKILVTNFCRYQMPLIRYDIGDMGRIITHKCSCGRQVKLMELLGRSDDTLIIGGGNIKLTDIAAIVGKIEGLTMHFRIIADTEGAKDRFSVEVETAEAVDETEQKRLEKALYDQLLLDKHEFLAFMRTGSILPPAVRAVAPETLPRNPRTGKLKQVVDRRTLN